MPVLDFSVCNGNKENNIGSLTVERGWRRYRIHKGGGEGGGRRGKI